MRHGWTIVIVAGLGLELAGCGEAPSSAKLGKVDERVIFGIDDRFNIVDHPDSRAEPWAKSVGILAPTAVVCPGVSECIPDLVPPTAAIGGVGYPLCMDAAFSGELAPDTGGLCSAFFVGNQFVDER
jgi:hypothetical protein